MDLIGYCENKSGLLLALNYYEGDELSGSFSSLQWYYYIDDLEEDLEDLEVDEEYSQCVFVFLPYKDDVVHGDIDIEYEFDVYEKKDDCWESKYFEFEDEEVIEFFTEYELVV